MNLNKNAFDLAVTRNSEGRSQGEIANELANMGYTTVRGNMVTQCVVSLLLRKKYPMGKRKYVKKTVNLGELLHHAVNSDSTLKEQETVEERELIRRVLATPRLSPETKLSVVLELTK